ncbi:hypothetical protein I79_010056 [Cricetulus griseus]|uniref:Uncharacterized protein n=1 Tax=Cricetulus griseus TaxID=10029 RepID=G3HHF5_CRIGR|nr:hypothetical protein I79_010056 [Cricetulus griseus]
MTDINSYVSEYYGDNKIGSREKQTIMDLKLGSAHSKLDDFIRVAKSVQVFSSFIQRGWSYLLHML